MARNQYAVFAEGTRAHHHLEFAVRADASAEALQAAVTGVRLAAEDHRATGGVNMVVSFGPSLWKRLAGERAPADLFDFPGYENAGAGVRAPATQADIWVWLHGNGPDAIIDVARAVGRSLAPIAEPTLDQACFTYLDSRDLTGFIDGLANPFLDEARTVAIVPDGEPGEGGVFAMTMRFVHDLASFDALPVGEQERVFGRTKRDGVELTGDAKPANAHIARVEAEDDDGEELEVYRRSVPFGSLTIQGLHFVSFGADLARFDRQLRQMFGLTDDGIVDHLLSFTTPETGSFWFCPSVEDLDAVGPLPEDDD